MSGTNKVLQSAVQMKNGSNSAMVSALSNANENAAKKEQTGKKQK